MFNWYRKEKPVQGLIGGGGGATGFLTGGGSGGAGFSGTGGHVAGGTEPGDGYRYHYFKGPGSYNFAVDPGYSGDATGLEIMVIAGGGGGGTRTAGGGGAGGIAIASSIPFNTIPAVVAGTNIPITVGRGAPEGPTPGSDSSFGSAPQPFYIYAKGGGHSASDGTNSLPGGSGGGSHYGSDNWSTGIQPQQNPGKPWISNYGNPGNTGYTPHPWESGGGGGAGGAAIAGGAGFRGRAGASLDVPQFPHTKYLPAGDPFYPGMNGRGSTTRYGGGGGAGSYPPYAATNDPTSARQGGGAAGGPSGGGRGGFGVHGTGGGGGGSCDGNPNVGGGGGHGMVVIRYPVV